MFVKNLRLSLMFLSALAALASLATLKSSDLYPGGDWSPSGLLRPTPTSGTTQWGNFTLYAVGQDTNGYLYNSLPLMEAFKDTFTFLQSGNTITFGNTTVGYTTVKAGPGINKCIAQSSNIPTCNTSCSGTVLVGILDNLSSSLPASYQCTSEVNN